MSNEDNKYSIGYGSQISGDVSFAVGGNSGVASSTPAAEQAASTTLDLGISSTASTEPVKDITTADFMSEVIEASKQKPVLIDFWAPWCGPCKQLTPIIEAVVSKAGGKVKLVKMNIDDHPEVAGQMGIQSIPAVIAFVDGQPRDAFMGAKSESEIDQFIEKLVGPSGPSPLDEALVSANTMMEEENYQQAAQVFSSILQQIPDNLDALGGLANAQLKLGNPQAAGEILAVAPEDSNHIGIVAARAALDLTEQANAVGEFAELEAQVSQNPKNHQARFDLAIALNGANRLDEAADHLLEIIETDRKWNEDGAREQLLKFFEAWGPTNPSTLAARRKLSSLLFS